MSDYIKGLVSVVMPTYKRSEMLIRAIESVLTQTYTNLELLLVNDNNPGDVYSLDLINKVAKYRADVRFRFIEQDKHVNGAVARNVGIRQAKGEYIAFLDDDDWWMPTKLETQVDVLNKLDDSWGGVSCKYTLYDSTGSVIGKSVKYCDGYIYKDILYLLSDVATGTLLLKRTYFDTTRYFDENLLRHQDLQLLVDFTSRYKLKEIDEFLHCVDVSDAQNRPNPEKLISYKTAFFESIGDTMDGLTSNEKKWVFAMHKFELGYVYFRNKRYIKFIVCCIPVLCHIRTIYMAIKKVNNRFKMMRF